jgi:hypothetical protein
VLPQAAAISPELAAIEVVWGKTDESGDLLAAHAAELRQQGDEGEGEHRADARSLGQRSNGRNRQIDESPYQPTTYTTQIDEIDGALINQRHVCILDHQAVAARRRAGRDWGAAPAIMLQVYARPRVSGLTAGIDK